MNASLPLNEAARLDALRQCDLLDTPPQQEFDDLVHLATLVCGVPMATVTLVDSRRQWFKASIGLAEKETPRDISFCSHTILEPDLLMVPDAAADSRFADSPLVTGGSHIRFYAGAPLVTAAGHALGALCVLDTAPRELTAAQQDALRRLARQAVALLVARRDAISSARSAVDREEAANESQRFFQSTLDALASHVAVLDETGKITAVNRAWQKFAEENAGTAISCGVGANYVDVCTGAGGEWAEEAGIVVTAIRDIMAGQRDCFSLEYPCHSPETQRWFTATITRFEGEGPVRVVVAHENITARKLAEESIRASERNLAIAQEIAHLGSWEITLVHADGLGQNPTRWSDEVYRILGLEPGSGASYDFFRARVHPDDRAEVDRVVQQAIRDRAPYEIEHRIVRPDGAVRVVHRQSSVGPDQAGQPLKLFGTIQDVTERVENERALSAFAAIVSSSNDAILSKTLEGVITSWNAGASKLFGYSEAEAVGQKITMLFPPDRLDEEPLLLDQLARGEVVDHFETVRVRKDGQPVDISVTLSPIRDTQGRVVGISKIARDITERKRAEQGARESEARIAGIVNAAMDAIITVDTDQRIVLFNPAAEQMFGYSGADIMGESLERLIPVRFREAHAAHVRRFAANDTTSRRMGALGALSGLRASGEEFPVEASISQIEIGGQKLLTVILRDITERKHAEAELRERVEFQRALLENFPNGSVNVFDLDVRYVMAAGKGLEAIGLTPEHLVGRTLAEVFAAEQVDYVAPFYQRVIQGENVDFDLSVGERFYSINAVPLRDANGDVANILAVAQDITERKEAEEALRGMRDELEVRVEERTFSLAQSNAELEAQIEVRQRAEAEVLRGREALQSFLDAMSTLAAKVAPDGSFLFANKMAIDAAGLPLDEYFATNFLEGHWWTFDPAVHARVKAAFATAVAGTAVNYDENLYVFDRQVTINFGLTPIKDAQGNVEYIVAEGRDITALKSTEEALRSAEQMLQLVMNQIPQAIFWKDRDCLYLGANNKFTRDAGFDLPSELVGKSDYDLPWAEFASLYRSDDLEVMETDTAKLDIEEPLTRSDGSSAWLRTSKIPLHDKFENVVGVLASYEDITERKQAETALIEARQEADAANLAKSEFLSRMSHELRTPLNAILGFGQILDKKELEDLEKESVGHIVKSGRHLLALINEILDISRVEAGRIELSPEPVALSDVIPEACAMMRPLAAERSILLVQEPAEIDRGHVLADRQRLKQVLINLLSNAIKYNNEGGSVRIQCENLADSKTTIAVTDTGQGIAPEDIQKLFTPFERLHADSTPVEGTGLGLVLSQRLVMAMGGDLRVESTVGRGTTFTITLPEAAPTMAQSATLVEMAATTKRNEDGTGPCQTVLCIEDNPSNLRLMEVLLEDRLNIKLLTAIQGSIGLDLARQNEPDLILLDLNLPDIHGREVLERLQRSALTQNIPVIVVSADATPTQIERLLAAGACAYLTKPLDVDKFLGALDQFMPPGLA